MGLFAELKRRNVYRVGVAYIVIAWLVLQVADVILGNIDGPDWLFESILAVLVLGFPLALVLAWVFELTPEGIRRDRHINGAVPRSPDSSRMLDRIIIVVLTIAVVYFLADKWIDRVADTADELSAAATEISIAVLPFVNRSAAEDSQFFVDGMHDDILTQLANLSGFDKVISRTSTERYRDTTKSIPQIGQELGVATILEGGVQRAGDRVRINMQLIDAATDEHIWADTYERELTLENLFDVQSQISREVTTALHAVLTEDDKQQLARVPTNNLQAYEQYVLGRRELAKRTGEALLLAASHFEKAVELDPDYAAAYVGLADAIAMQVEYAGLDFEASVEPRERNINKALSLNPRSGEAYASLGFLRYWGRDHEAAERAFLRAIELSPNYPSAYHWYSVMLRRKIDRREESLPLMKKAVSLDPAAQILIASLVDNLRFLGRHEEAESTLLDAVEQHPDFAGFYVVMKDLLLVQGRIGEAAAWLDRASALNPARMDLRAQNCDLLIELDDPDAAEACISQLLVDFDESPEAAFFFHSALKTEILTLRGEEQAAVEYATKLAESGADPRLYGVLVGAYFHNAEWEKMRPILEMFTPKFFAPGDIDIAPAEIEAALGAAVSMREGDGWSERARYLAGQALQTMRGMHRTRGIGFRFADVNAHLLRAELEEALSALREAINSGSRLGWWSLRSKTYELAGSDETYGSEWSALVSQLEEDIAEQRAWYYANKDQPLF